MFTCSKCGYLKLSINNKYFIGNEGKYKYINLKITEIVYMSEDTEQNEKQTIEQTDSSPVTFNYLRLNGYIPMDESENVIEKFQDIGEVKVLEPFIKKELGFKEDNKYLKIEGDGNPITNFINVYSTEFTDGVKIRIGCELQSIPQTETYIKLIMDTFGSIGITDIVIDFDIDKEFKELDIETVETSKYTGIKYIDDGYEYYIATEDDDLIGSATLQSNYTTLQENQIDLQWLVKNPREHIESLCGQ